MSATVLTACRLCDSGELDLAIDFGRLAPCGVFPATKAEDPPTERLRLVRCRTCGLVQLGDTLPPATTFNTVNFGYRSATNPSMVAHLRKRAAHIRATADLKAGDLVIDIGSNDGTFLAELGSALGLVGVDPVAERYEDLYPAGAAVVTDFWSREVAERYAGRAKMITCFACLYDMPDPRAFMHAVALALARDGVFCCEVAFLPFVMANNGFDIVSHEHLTYWDALALHSLIEGAGLRITLAEGNEINGGSIYIEARRIGPAIGGGNVVGARDLVEWGGRIAKSIAEVDRFLLTHQNVHGLAASTRGNTLLQMLAPEARRRIRRIADRNPEKVGRFTPGTLIPIISEEESRAGKPDYYLCLSWHFRQSMLAREAHFLARGGRVVFPLPRLEVIGKGSEHVVR